MRLMRLAFLFVPLIAFGAPAREIVDLQRDVAALQAQINALQSTSTEKFAALLTMLQQTLEETKSANRAVAVLESKINDRLERQVNSVAQPVAEMGTKVERMSGEFQGLRETLADVNSRIGKLEQRIVDLGNAVRTMQAPPPAPGPSASAPAPPMPANALYEAAVRDRMSGNAALALKEFSDYVQFYGDTAAAADAQFWIGRLRYDQNDFENAVKDFDLVVERYPSSDRTAEALLYKGQALVKLNRKTDGIKEFRSVLSQFPRSAAAPQACSQLKAVGMNCAAPTAQPASKKKKG